MPTYVTGWKRGSSRLKACAQVPRDYRKRAGLDPPGTNHLERDPEFLIKLPESGADF